jgi:hypothetical protein
MAQGNVGTRVIIVAMLLELAGCRFGPPPEMADVGATLIAASADIQTDQRTVEELLVTFHRADKALHQQDLDTLMNIYSKNYNYHGIDKAELRNIWQDLFTQYRDFSSTHVFSKIVVDEKKTSPTAGITCTGSIWAISRVTGQRVNIDSWFGDVHHLVYEDGKGRVPRAKGLSEGSGRVGEIVGLGREGENGAWRIVGHAWEAPRDTRYVLSPHPFF